MESIAFIQWCLDHLNYFTITLLMMIESSFIPFPSEVVIPPAAYMAATSGELNVVLVVLFGTLGAILGGLINYGLAYYLGRPIVYSFARSRVGAMLLLDEKKVRTAEQYFYRHGAISTFIGRLVPAVRQLISIPAGLAKMPLGKFILYTALGAGAWNIILAALGYYLAKIVPQDQLMASVTKYSHEIGYTFLAIAILIVAYLIYRGWRKPKTETFEKE